MRDYLFRGKPKDKEQFNAFSITWAEYCFNGFVYGSLVKCNNRCYIAVTAQSSIKSIINNGITTMIEVIPETVGQYTGLTDKNGKKIFEGDIVAMPAYGGGKHKAVVYFKGGKFAVDGSNYGFKDIAPKRMKVIGNIYDNKEILDVK